MLEQPKWIERARETHKYHRLKLSSVEDWRLQDTARSLRRSLGSVCEDLLIARWLRTHEKQLEKFSYAYEALEFIRNKRKEQELGMMEEK